MSRNEILAERLAAARKESGYTQDEIADFLRCSRVTVTKFSAYVFGGATLPHLLTSCEGQRLPVPSSKTKDKTVNPERLTVSHPQRV